MSGPIRFIILAIVIGIKKSRCVCFVRKLCSVQSIHTELAKLYSKKVIFRVVCPADLWGGKLDSTMGSLSLVFLVTRSFTTPVNTYYPYSYYPGYYPYGYGYGGFTSGGFRGGR